MTTNTDAGATQGLFPTRRQGHDCLSDLALDRLLLGEGGEGSRHRAHLESCEACKGAFARLKADRERFASEVDVPTRAALLLDAASRATRVDLSRRWVRALTLPLGLSAAAAAFLLVARPSMDGIPDPSPVGDSRIKGDFQVATYVRFRDRQQPGTLYMGEPLRAGDQVQFRVSTSQPGYLVIVGVDSQAQVSLFYPPGPAAARLETGRDKPLETAVEIDATPGHEVVVALRCNDAVTTAQVIAAARTAVGRARESGLPATSIGALGLPCVEAKTTLTKSGTPSGEPAAP